MTVQAQESLEYRDEKYSLLGAPLFSYLEQNKHIQFEDFSTAHWNGYQGYWLLESDNLYLTNIESANYSMNDLFKTDKPVLADWFSGKIEFGIGNYHDDHWWGYYDNYVWLNIVNGKVIEKKISRKFDQESKITFGRYKGKNVEDVINGKIYRNTNTTIKDFIICLLEFIKNKEYKFNVQCPRLNVTEEDIELIRTIRDCDVEYFLTQNVIAVFLKNSKKDKKASKLSNLLEKIFSSDFRKLFTLTRKDLKTAEIAEQTILINGDIGYLLWAIKTVDLFSIPPHQLEMEYRLKRLYNFKINRLNDFIFEYEPIVEIINYKFSDNIIKVNQEKFEKINNVKYDSVNKLYTLNLNDNILMYEFGHYLDENYIKNQSSDWIFPSLDDLALERKNRAEFYENNSDDYDSNDWLRDVAGTDDPEVMNDVYWNLD